jgi:hypothetical protein
VQAKQCLKASEQLAPRGPDGHFNRPTGADRALGVAPASSPPFGRDVNPASPGGDHGGNALKPHKHTFILALPGLVTSPRGMGRITGIVRPSAVPTTQWLLYGGR